MEWLSRFTLPPMRAMAILLAASVTVSVALDNLLMALLLLLGLLGSSREIVAKIAANPVARAAWLLFGILFVATLYGATPWKEALNELAKYDDLAFIPLFMTALAYRSDNRLAISAFMLAMVVTLVLSCLLGLGVIGPQHWMWRDAAPENAGIFRSYITQGIMTAYASFLALLFAREAKAVWKRAVFGIFALAGIGNVLFLVLGRTGYLVLFGLLTWFAWSTLQNYLHKRGKAVGWHTVAVVAVLAVLAVWATYEVSDRLHERVNLVVSEYRAWQPNVANQTSNGTSTGERLTFYYNTLQIIQAHLPFGVGTGGFSDAYAKQVAGTGIMQTHNPHDEYLLMLAQGGLPALALMLYWLYAQWRQAPKLENPWRQDAARGLVITIALSCLVNSSLLDHTEGLFFAYMSAVLFADLKDKA